MISNHQWAGSHKVDNEVAFVTDTLDELQGQLKHMNDGQALLLEVTQRIAHGGSLGAMLPDIINATLRISGADGIRVIVNEEPRPLTYASGPAVGRMLKFDKLLIDLVAENGAVQAPDLAKHAGPQMDTLRGVFGAMLALPLVAQGTLHGLLWVTYDQPQQFDQGDVALLSILAAQIAVAIANAHAFNAARRGEEQLAAILDSSADPVLVVDENESILLLNPSAESAFGVHAHDWLAEQLAK